MKKKTALLVAFLLLLLMVCGFYRFETTVVPSWKVRLVDEQGVPYEGLRVVEYWKHYSLELEAGDNGEER